MPVATDDKFLIPVMGKGKRKVLVYLIGIWIISLTLFLIYWCRPEHIVGWGKFIINTLLLFWINLLPGYFFFFVSRMKQVNPDLEIPS
jgi:cellulose synthase (UDP-forming)